MSVDSHTSIDLPPAVPGEPIWRLSVGQYHEMLQAGILTEDDPVELLDGWLVTKMGKNPRHAAATDAAREALERVLPAGWYVRVQDPITLARSEPEPDLAVVRGHWDNYLHRHPGPRDLALVVEVADTTLHRDRTIKRQAYARGGVGLYWIVNLLERQVEVLSDPTGPVAAPDYRQSQIVPPGEALVLTVEGREVLIAVNDLLPPP